MSRVNQRAGATKSAVQPIVNQNASTVRSETAQEIKTILQDSFHEDHEKLEGKVREIEEAIYFNTIRSMVQSSDAQFLKSYKAFSSNLIFNLTKYQHKDELVSRIWDSPVSTLNTIIINGPLEMNRELPEIQELQRQEEINTEPRVRLAPNVSGVYCPKCRSDQVNMQLVQIKGSDEAATRFYTCLNPTLDPICGKEWRRG